MVAEARNLLLTRFGETLRAFRQASNDPDRLNRRLTQERLGQLIGQELGDFGFSGAAISYWERGESRISPEDRTVLIALIKVLHRCSGLQTLADANQLLAAGNYSPLQRENAEEIFGEIQGESSIEQPGPEQKTSKSLGSFPLADLLSISENELRALFAKAEEGPSPSWPRVLAAILRKISERIFLSPKTVLWIVIWWIAWWLMAPSLRWPFEDRAMALQAVGMYVVGTLVVPLLIGMFIDTKHNEYWKAQGLAHSRLLRLYTYQGAGIGFNLGYFFVLPLVLVRYYLGLGSSHWPVLIAVTLGLILANMSARVVPHNLWLAYHRLRFGDGAIFFGVAFVGPLWGLFFLEYYTVLLEPFWGGMVILAALLLFIMIPIKQSKKRIDMEQVQP